MITNHLPYLKRSLFFIVFLLSCLPFTKAQQSVKSMLANDEPIPCATDYVHEKLMNTDPIYRMQHERLQEHLYKTAKRKLEEKAKDGSLKNNSLAACAGGSDVLTIPIVIYIVHSTSDATPTDGTSNPTDAQIIQGIQHLNDAFQNVGAYAGHGHGANDGTNPDASLLESVDVEIQFCLAQRDINGNPTTGIYRTPNDTYSDLDIDSEIANMKAFVESQVGVGLFPDTDYAGVWLHDQLCSVSSGLGCGIGGFAGPSLGVLNLARIFGSSTNGSTVHIHEFGHYFSLAHTWSGGCTVVDPMMVPNCLVDGDGVCDTPPDDSTSGVGCNTAQNTCSTDTDSGPFTVDQDDLYENYMDYSSSSCQNTFTQGQKERMRTSLLSRSSLLASKGCINPNMLEAGITDFVFPNALGCETTFSPIINVENNGNATLTTLVFNVSVDGGGSTSVSTSVSIAVGASAQVTLDPVTIAGTGSHDIDISIATINGAAADSYTRNNSLCNSFIYELPVTSLNYCEDMETGNLSNFVQEEFKGITNTADAWSSSNCANNGSFSLRFNTWENRGSISTTDKARAYIKITDLSSYLDPVLEFDLANTRSFSNTNTGLKILASGDCGATMTTLYDKTSSELATVSGFVTGSTWVPADCSAWRTETIDLSDFGGCPNVLLVFEVDARNPTNNGFFTIGQNVYLDNICINGTLCTALTNTSTSPGTISSCDSPTNVDLTVGNKATVITDPTKEVTGWWITKDNAITTTAINKPSTETALTGATIGGALGMNANVIYEGDGTTGAYTLPVDCNNLESGATYYATPFVSKKEAAIPTENCVVDVNSTSSIGFNGFPGKFNRVAPGSVCRPSNPPNSPTFTYCITVSGYTGDPGNLSIVIRDDNFDGNTLVNNFFVGTGDGNATYCYTEADMSGYDPGNPSLTSGLTGIVWEQGGSGMENGTLSTSLDITYQGAPAVNFPTTNYSNCLFGPAISFSCNCSALPIELSHFSGQAESKTNVLKWTTATENNTHNFVVERSATGKDNWSKIGEVAAIGQSNNSSDYTLVDHAPLNMAYYRLRSIDHNNDYALSNTVFIERKAQQTINVYPVPATNQVQLNYHSSTAERTLLTITDVVGRVVLQTPLNTTEGFNAETIEISQFSTGVYFITLNNPHLKMTTKIVKE